MREKDTIKEAIIEEEQIYELWSTGIIVKAELVPDKMKLKVMWVARAEIQDQHFADRHKAVEVQIKNRYFCEDLAEAIDNIMLVAEQTFIHWGRGEAEPTIYYEGDGVLTDSPPPKGWEHMLFKQCERLGWKSIYSIPEEG